MGWRDFLYFSKGERRGLSVVLCLVALACILMIRNQKSDTVQEIAVEQPSIPSVTSQITGADAPTPTSSGAGKSAKQTGSEKKSSPSEGAPLRKQGATSSSLAAQSSAGSSDTTSLNADAFNASEASNTSDVSNVSIASNDKARSSTEPTNARKESVPERVQRLTSYGRPSYPRTEKFAEGTVVELNTADTTLLKKVPGIGSAFAKRIVGYRALLGGYYSVTQLSEVYGIDEDKYNALAPWFTADPSLIVRLSVNNLPQDSLRRHPYVNYQQAKIISQLRRQKGKLTGWENLQLLDEFHDADKIRLTPYLSFE